MPSTAIHAAALQSATAQESTPRTFSLSRALFRALRRAIIVLFFVNMALDMLIYHGIASSSARKPGEVLGWFATPYTSAMAIDYRHLVENSTAAVSRWYPKDFAISKSGTSHAWHASVDATAKFFKSFVKP